MAEMVPIRRLGVRLRELRTEWGVTQRQFSDALGLSGALVSSWENGTAVPPEERLSGYARFFATRRSLEHDPPTLIPAADLTSDEERKRSDLVDDLVSLREEALAGPASRHRDTGALGGRFWYFPDGQAITILCTPFSNAQLVGSRAGELDSRGVDASFTPSQQYALNPTHPNWIRNTSNGDIDALVELVGHIRAENPTVDVQWMTSDQISSANDLTGHVVILGSGDALIEALGRPGQGRSMDAFVRLLELPVSVEDLTEGDPEFDLQFVVAENEDGRATYGGHKREIYRPRFVRDEGKPERPWVMASGAPQLEYDAALIARRSNPLNGSARVTMCTGLFSRGTYGAVRAFTDEKLRARNERYLADSVDTENFWMLVQVPIFAGSRTITPDLGRPVHRLRTSS